MASYECVSDFLLTGCAIAPAAALYVDQPAWALMSHIVLLVLGLLFAAGDREAPFRNAQQFDRDRSSRTGKA